MSTPAEDLYLSEERYLESELSSNVRHEYVNGRIFAMVGATDAHETLCGNLFSLIRPQARAHGCHAYMNGMRVKVAAINSIYYPDILVTCEPYAASSLYKTAPLLIAEVLSPSTADIDRREKLIAYQSIERLSEYMIVYQDERLIEVNRRTEGEDKQWMLSIYKDKGSISIFGGTKLEMDVTLDEIYEGVL